MYEVWYSDFEFTLWLVPDLLQSLAIRLIATACTFCKRNWIKRNIQTLGMRIMQEFRNIACHELLNVWNYGRWIYVSLNNCENLEPLDQLDLGITTMPWTHHRHSRIQAVARSRTNIILQEVPSCVWTVSELPSNLRYFAPYLNFPAGYATGHK